MRTFFAEIILHTPAETKQWDRFWFSGSVEDYLRYKGCRQEEKQNEAYGGNGSREFSEDRDKFT